MRREDVVGWLVLAAAVLLLVPALVTRPASAARLPVSAAPVQTWKVDPGLPMLALAPFVPGDVALDLRQPTVRELTADTATPEKESEKAPGTAAAKPVPDDPASPPVVDLGDCGDPEQYDEVLYGTREDDVLTGGAGRQVLVGLGGDDVLIGGADDDCLVGGRGDDQLDAGGDQGDTCVEPEETDPEEADPEETGEVVTCEEVVAEVTGTADAGSGTSDSQGEASSTDSGGEPRPDVPASSQAAAPQQETTPDADPVQDAPSSAPLD